MCVCVDFEQREGHFAAVVLSKIKLPLIAGRGAAVSVTAGSRCKVLHVDTFLGLALSRAGTRAGLARRLSRVG